jgi:hypothetical protein
MSKLEQIREDMININLNKLCNNRISQNRIKYIHGRKFNYG